MNIEDVAKEKPEKIIKTKINSSNYIKEEEINKIIKPFFFSEKLKNRHIKLLNLYSKL